MSASTQKISLAVSWASTNPQLLDGLAKLHPPEETLIHLDHWRTDPYDINYPAYEPTPATRAYLEKARALEKTLDDFRMAIERMPNFRAAKAAMRICSAARASRIWRWVAAGALSVMSVAACPYSCSAPAWPPDRPAITPRLYGPS